MTFVHADVHIREIALTYKVRGQWSGEMTVVRPPNGREYAWARRLTHRERQAITQHFVEAPADVAIEAPVVDIYYSHPVGRWLCRPVTMES